jgi:hypothetical protein
LREPIAVLTFFELPNVMPTMRRSIAFLLVLAAFSLAGCDTPPTREPFPTLTYLHLPAYNLAVSRVDIVDAYKPPMTAPHVEQNFPVSPDATAQQWAHDRLKAAGGSARALYTVLRADAVETHLQGDQGTGLFGDFTIPQSERYDMNITVRLEIIDANGRVAASVDATATRSRTVAADATLNDRERVWFNMTEQAMADLNASLDKSIPQYLRAYLR